MYPAAEASRRLGEGTQLEPATIWVELLRGDPLNASDIGLERLRTIIGACFKRLLSIAPPLVRLHLRLSISSPHSCTACELETLHTRHEAE